MDQDLLRERAAKGQGMLEGGKPSGDCECGSPASPREPSPGLRGRVGRDGQLFL